MKDLKSERSDKPDILGQRGFDDWQTEDEQTFAIQESLLRLKRIWMFLNIYSKIEQFMCKSKWLTDIQMEDIQDILTHLLKDGTMEWRKS